MTTTSVTQIHIRNLIIIGNIDANRVLPDVTFFALNGEAVIISKTADTANDASINVVNLYVRGRRRIRIRGHTVGSRWTRGVYTKGRLWRWRRNRDWR